MTEPISDRFKDLPEITAEEIRVMIESGRVYFTRRAVGEDALSAILNEAVFKGIPVEADDSLIEGDLDFADGPRVTLEEVTINQDIKRRLQESGITSVVVLNGGLTFNGSYIKGMMSAQDTIFIGSFSFKEATFSEEVDLDFATFCSEVAFFDGTKFINNSSFKRSIFGGMAYFLRAKFYGETSFWGADFDENAQFGMSTFGSNVSFERTTFGKEAIFISTTFSKEAYFFSTTFARATHFTGSNFKGPVIFQGLGELRLPVIRNGMELRLEVVDENFVFEGEVDFRRVTLDDPDKVRFQHVDLSKVRFLETRLDRVRLIDVKWAEREERKAIYDEEFAEEEGYELVAQLYRQLKKNYEEERDYPGAGDFHYGEMEMMLKQQHQEWEKETKKSQKCKNWFTWFLTSSYKFLSGYGEKAERAIVITLAILLAGVPFYFFDKLTAATLEGIWSAFWDALISSMGYMTFRLTKVPTSWWAKPVLAVQAVLGPIQLALLALALRRKFRR